MSRLRVSNSKRKQIAKLLEVEKKLVDAIYLFNRKRPSIVEQIRQFAEIEISNRQGFAITAILNRIGEQK